jgi:pyrimidine operon attenuation protein/uracil phosphoribosyltransferase
MNQLIMDKDAIRRTIIRLSHEVMEKNTDLQDLVFIGIRRGGEVVAKRVQEYVTRQSGLDLPYAGIDIASFRDDTPHDTPHGERQAESGLQIPLDGKVVVLCDDVLHTGRSVRAAMDGLFLSGRPKEVQLLILVDRGGREIPVKADYVGKNVPMPKTEYVQVAFEELGATEDKLYITKLDERKIVR